MVFLDETVVNVALPSIKTSLGFSQPSLAWVINAYVLLFGGLILLGGRAADLAGRRRIFLIGTAIFGLASLADGLATSQGMLIGARALQGVGAALATPAALALVTSLFPAGAARTRALTLWGALSGLGFAAGVLLGGVITQAASWRWVFFINVPIALAGLLVVPRLVTESRDPGGPASTSPGPSPSRPACPPLFTLCWKAPGTAGRPSPPWGCSPRPPSCSARSRSSNRGQRYR
jgi:MFS family permease